MSYVRKTTPGQRAFLYTVATILVALGVFTLAKIFKGLNNEFYSDEPRPGIESDEFEWK